eukprot:Amastigsp_a340473_24.p1 type:complete len:705 gc:universal Amastigsp_a340473_24:27-2141(+)
MAAAQQASPLTTAVVRGLSEKLYDKRKGAALQIENRVRELVKAGDNDAISRLILDLDARFVENPQANTRKGGVIGLAAVAIGLGPDLIGPHLSGLLKPPLRAFQDRDARVRYYALEAVYNVSKVARGGVLPLFNELFDGMCRLCADLEPAVKSGVLLLDRLVKDIVTETDAFDVRTFVPLLERRIVSENPFVRQFLLNWITVLDSVPAINMLDRLPAFLEGLFVMLSDVNSDIRRLADGVVAEFLREIEEAETVDVQPMIPVVVRQCGSPSEYTQLTALLWASAFVQRGQSLMVPHAAPLLGSVLPGMASDVEEIAAAALQCNQHLVALMSATTLAFSYGALVDVLTAQLDSPWVATRSSALQWLLMLHLRSAEALGPLVDTLIATLLRVLLDRSVRVVRLALEVLAKIAATDRTNFQAVFSRLFAMIRAHPSMLDDRAALVLRQFAVYLSPVEMYSELARLVLAEPLLGFARRVVETLNVILLTAPELNGLRTSLRDLNKSSESDCALFTTLYKSWCHDAVATFSLCILCQAYDHATVLVKRFGDVDITVEFLLEVDKFVQLLESPIFTHLRLQLLEPARHVSLYKCLYGLLMLLPQSTAFRSLHSRLTSIATLSTVALERAPGAGGAAGASSAGSPSARGASPTPGDSWLGVDFDSLLAHFDATQRAHEDAHRRLRARERTDFVPADDEVRPTRRLFDTAAE